MKRSHFLILYNPLCGPFLQRRVKRFSKALYRLGGTFKIMSCLEDFSWERDIEGCDFDGVLIAGGDGTLRRTMLRFLDTSMPVGILPFGTANVLAKELGLPKGYKRLARYCMTGSLTSFRPALCGEEPFLLMVGMGFDGGIIGDLHPHFKRFMGRVGIFFFALLRIIKGVKGECVHVEMPGRSLATPWVIVARSSFYAGAWRLSPNFSWKDNALLVVAFKKEMTRFRLVRFFWALHWGRLEKIKDLVDMTKTDKVTLKASLSLGLSQMDGDPCRLSPTTSFCLGAKGFMLITMSKTKQI